MSDKISRREFQTRALAAGAAVAISAKGQSQAPKPVAANADDELKTLEAKLEKPLPAKLRAPAKAALKNLKTAAADRLKFKLPEGSEPCTSFAASPARSRVS